MNLFLTFQRGLVGAFVVLFGTFLFVMVSESVERCVSQLFGLSAKNETLKFLGIGMGGVLLALQAMMSYKRAKALEDAVRSTEQGQRQERLKNAIEHLGHASDSVRLGGAYELFHLAQDTKDLRQTVLDILCAHIRRMTGEDEYRKKYRSKPSEEIQSLLTLLFVQEHEVFKGLHINLQGSWLNGANLTGSHLQGADLSRARLQGADLSRTHLQGADLGRANLQGSLLRGAHLQGSDLLGAYLQGSLLPRAQFQGATLAKADLRGANSQGNLSYTFAQRIRASAGKKCALALATFEGGLKREDLDSLVEDWSDERVKHLQELLEPHIGKPASHELPRNSGAITKPPYTAEEAEQWIAEYEEVMSVFNEAGDN